MYYVYLIKSIKSDYMYTGYTDDLKRRLLEHNNRHNISTKSYAPFKLVYYESYRSKKDATERERMLKHKGSSIGFLKKRIKNSLNE
jgi:putative endonuclease